MNLKERHMTCIEILGSIEIFAKKISLTNEWINGFGCRNFPSLLPKAKHDIEIYKMCIARLRQRYYNQITHIVPEHQIF